MHPLAASPNLTWGLSLHVHVCFSQNDECISKSIPKPHLNLTPQEENEPGGKEKPSMWVFVLKVCYSCICASLGGADEGLLRQLESTLVSVVLNRSAPRSSFRLFISQNTRRCHQICFSLVSVDSYMSPTPKVLAQRLAIWMRWGWEEPL